MTVTAIVALALGTFAFRFAGPLLRDRITLSDRVQTVIRRAATVLLAGLVATAAVMDGGEFAGWALPAGVGVGGLLAWRRAPFVVVVVAAAAATALLRLLGVP
ncbi:branched-subunit amino acid transport protein AzlD [Stackebrandtia albiflava]|uniref:Branched-subunit amino acid transport protein AzlD n=1 Tax=Stackebrandtia albiflava TaxID=406432 RepID=A0A562VC06_9ACTN|nr:AzlD domain-containing protein [Stackebrandtia albiflava]TWJ15341.1 branched-subunit amino acid transport protein AzlD [Stackebrandtia albiflava]